MKRLLKGLLTLVGSLTVTAFLLPLQVVYSFGYSLYLCQYSKSLKPFYSYWRKMFVGVFHAIGYIFEHTGIVLDMIWNVFGELLEDIVTAKDISSFGTEEMTVSASLGELEANGDLNKKGKFLVKLLNIVFNQKNHCIDAFLWYNIKKDFWSNIEPHRDKNKTNKS